MGAVYGGSVNRSARTLTHVETIDGLSEGQPEYDTVAGCPGVVGVCPICGDAWVKITNFYLCPYSNEPKQSEFRVKSSPCPDHGGGSLLPVWPTAMGLRRALSPQALLREYLLATKEQG